MNELEFDGRMYVSTRRAAELTKYTKDYIGQLARGQKIPARLVGRNWYVDEQVLLQHAGLISGVGGSALPVAEPMSPEESIAVGTEDSSNEEVGEVESESFHSSHTSDQSDQIEVKDFAETEERPFLESHENSFESPVHYEEDSSELLPQLQKDISSVYSEVELQTQNVEVESAVPIRVHTRQEPVSEKKHPSNEFAPQQFQSKREISQSHVSGRLRVEPKIRRSVFQLPSFQLSLFVASIIFGGIAITYFLYPNSSSQVTKNAAKGNLTGENQKASSFASFLERSFVYERN